MIGALRGRIAEKAPNRIVVDVQGVGYEVHVPLSTYYELGGEGADVHLRIYTHVREDALQLYGFLTDLERQMFERLISVSGIGPRLAVAVLSGLETRDLVSAVRRADVARLTTIPGVGRKTAERIVLELKDRLTQLSVSAAEETVSALPDTERVRADLISALQNLGYHRPQAEKAVDAARGASPDATFEHVLRQALREMK
jgi:holliday junction DNA helicase RuvA